MFIFLIVSGKKGWVIQTSPSASGLGPGSVFTLIFVPQGTCVSLGGKLPTTSHICSKLPTKVPQRSERSELSLKRQNTKGTGGNKAGKGPPINDRKGEVSKKGFFPPQPRLLPAFPSNPCFSLGTTPCVRGKDQGHQKASEWTA